MTVTRARLIDAHAGGIYSLTRCKIGEKERSQESNSLVWAIVNIRVSIYWDGEAWRFFQSLIFAPGSCPLVCYNSGRETLHFTSTFHFPTIWSSEKCKSFGIHLVTQNTDNPITFMFYQHSYFSTFYKENKSMCVCVSPLCGGCLNMLLSWKQDCQIHPSEFHFAPGRRHFESLSHLHGWLLTTLLFPSWTLVYFRPRDRWAHPDLKMQNLSLCQTIILC